MADTQYDNTNRFSLWSQNKGPVSFSGVINVNGEEYNLKLLRLAKEKARACLLVEDKTTFAPVGSGYLYEPKFDDLFLSGMVTVHDKDYYVNMYKNSKGGEKSPVFSGKIKPAGETTATKSSAPAQETEDDEW